MLILIETYRLYTPIRESHVSYSVCVQYQTISLNLSTEKKSFTHFSLGKVLLDLSQYIHIYTLPETSIAHENPIFPGKYHQNGGFSMAMLVSGSVDINSNKYVSFYVTSALLIEPRLGWNQRQAETSTYGFWSKLSSSWKPRVHCCYSPLVFEREYTDIVYLIFPSMFI